MKKILFTALLALLATGVGAQEQQKEEGYRFTDVKTLPVTSVKNQNRSGTCWAYSALAFLESEILRNGGGEYDLSAMWIVRNAYFEKAVKYARMHGSLNLAVGGGSRDVTDGIKKYGIVPTEVYPGLCYGTDLPDFTEIDRVVKGYMDAVIAGDKLTTAWQRGLDAVLDAYLGPKPEKFTWKGKEYTPQSFAASLGLDMDDYVEISSYTHHPFYEEFILEVPDNWMWGTVWNLPLDEMMAVVDNALANDYTVLWGTDVSEKGFSPHEGDRHRARGRPYEHERHRRRALGQTLRQGEGGGALQVRQARQGARHHAADASGGVRQLRDYRRPRYADHGHGGRPGGQRLLQGEEFMGRASSLRRVLLFLASFRGLQDDVGHGQQEGYSGTYPQEDGTLTGRRPAIGGERFDRSLFHCTDP